MPASSFVDSSSRLVITLCVGEVTLAEITATLSEIRNHPAFQPDFRQLADLSQVSAMPLHFPDVYHLQQTCDPFSNQGKRAVVANDTVIFGLSRMYQLIVNSPNFEVFRSLHDAVAWLEWNEKQLQGTIRELGSNKSSAEPPASPAYTHPEAQSSDLIEFLKRLQSGTTA